MPVYIIPFIGAFIGWLLMFVTLRLFLNARNMQETAIQLSRSLLAGLVQPQAVVQKLKDPENLKALTPTIDAHLDTFLQQKLQEKLPFIATFVGESTLAKIKEAMKEEIDILFPEVIAQYADTISKDIELQQLIADKLSAMPPGKLQAAMKDALQAKLNMLAIAGAIIGFVASSLAILLQ